jgi:hypothetical protein
MIATKDLAWIAGIVEGEGCYSYSKSPNIQVSMTDGDVIDKLHALMAGSSRHSPWMRKDGYKPVHTLVVHGSDAIGWMMTLYSFMGVRRRARIREILAKWKLTPRGLRSTKRRPLTATCHPGHPIAGQGLCQSCYMRAYRAKRKAAKLDKVAA